MFDQAQDTMAATNRLMLRADACCQNNSSCPFHIQGKDSVLKVRIPSKRNSALLMGIQAFKQVIQIAKKTPFFFSPCVNSTVCYSYSTDFDVRTVLYGNTVVLDFPAILDGIYAALNGDGSFFVDGPPNFDEVVAMPILCNDYSKLKACGPGILN